MTTIAFQGSAFQGDRLSGVTPSGAPRPRARTRLTRRGRAVLAALLVLPLLIGGGVLAANSGAEAGIHGSASASFHHVTVQQGESLWAIATHVAPHSDPRDVITAIVDLNGLSSTALQAGQRLAIPHQYDGAR